MSEEWQPPRRKVSNGTYEFGDWRPIRDAIDAAQKALGGEPFKDIPLDIWNMVGLAMNYHEFATIPTCVECQERISHGHVIRCLDCKAALHELCATKHFWPRGKASYPGGWTHEGIAKLVGVSIKPEANFRGADKLDYTGNDPGDNSFVEPQE